MSQNARRLEATRHHRTRGAVRKKCRYVLVAMAAIRHCPLDGPAEARTSSSPLPKHFLHWRNVSAAPPVHTRDTNHTGTGTALKTLTRYSAVMAVVVGLLGMPTNALAADGPRRVAALSGDYGAITSPEPDGTGRAVLRPKVDTAKICYRFTWKRMEVRNLQVRRRSNGNTVAQLYDEAPTTSGELTGCSTSGRNVYYPLTSRRVREIAQHPKRFYVVASTYTGEQIAGTLRRPVS